MALGQFLEGQFPAQLTAKRFEGGKGVYRVASPMARNACAEARGAVLYGVEDRTEISVRGFGQVSQIPQQGCRFLFGQLVYPQQLQHHLGRLVSDLLLRHRRAGYHFSASFLALAFENLLSSFPP